MTTDLLTLLRQHVPTNAHEADMTARTVAFVENHPNHLKRSLLKGHVTASAWIVAGEPGPEPQVLLIHHRKLDRWLQPGGHADGDPDVAEVARREAWEETGLADLELVSPAIFDVDIHTIPARNDVPEHLHYDVRFLFRAKKDGQILVGENREVRAIRWLTMTETEQLTADESICRMVRKSRKWL